MNSDTGATDRSDAETTAVLEDIRIAEEQIGRGEGIDHDAAERNVFAGLRLGRTAPPAEVVSAEADSVKL